MSYTINPNAKNKWARNAENTMDLSLETDASSVYLDNGRTLEQEIGEGSMVSNVATVDSVMSKVIDGTLDGAYESLVFKGKSLVNLFDKSEIATNHPSYTVGTDNTISFVANNGFTDGVDLSHLKPNTKYALFFDVLAVPQEPNIPYRINDDGTNYNINIFGAGQDNPASGFHSFTTGNSVSDLKFYFYTNLRNVGFKLTLPVIIEYQEDMEDWSIPYFEGICDVKMPILRNVGKNLLDESTLTVSNNDTIYIRKYGKFPCKPNTKYRFISSKGESACNWHYYKDGNDNNPVYGGYSATTTTPSGCHYLHIHTGNPLSIDPTTIKTMVVEDGQDVTYEDHKTNILQTPEEIILREVNGVQDTYNPLIGEYVKQIGEVVLDGSENWWETSIAGQTIKRFRVNFISKSNNSNQILICDGILSVPNSEWNVDREQIEADGKILSIRKAFDTVEDFKTWLSQNPLTVQYVLVEPITTIVESLTTPFTYENGHIILESGYEGQSLLPTLEYSTVVNKTGLIENVAKTIQRQEKQLTMLEKMLIQNIINLDYNNTLLTLKNEMEEML